jgi:hypothetical protein
MLITCLDSRFLINPFGYILSISYSAAWPQNIFSSELTVPYRELNIFKEIIILENSIDVRKFIAKSPKHFSGIFLLSYLLIELIFGSIFYVAFLGSRVHPI